MQCLDEYNNDFQTYVQSGQVLANCAEITFINQGTSSVVINSTLTLTTNQSLSCNGNRYEFDRTPYTIRFDNTGMNNLVVIRKYYLNQSV